MAVASLMDDLLGQWFPTEVLWAGDRGAAKHLQY